MPLPELEIPSPTTSEGTRSPTPKGPAERTGPVTRGKRASVVGAGGYSSKNRVVQVHLGDDEGGSVSGALGLSPRSADPAAWTLKDNRAVQYISCRLNKCKPWYSKYFSFSTHSISVDNKAIQ